MSASATGSPVAPTVRTALVSGGGSGIGRATAEKFLHEGWQVVATGRRLEPLHDLEKKHAGKVLAIPCDLTNADEVTSLCQRLNHDDKFGGSLCALINNAGAYERFGVGSDDDAHWLRMLEANLLSAVRLTRGLLPLLRSHRGVIINVASTLGLKPIPETAAYSAAKAAMINWTKCLALESGKHGVRANCVCPGIVDTPIHPFHSQEPAEKAKTLASLANLQVLGRIGTPQEIAHSIWSLCAPGSEWTTGSLLVVDGGISLL